MPAANQLLQQGRYRITQPLEQNGAGASYRAFDEVHQTEVILRETVVQLNKVTTAAQQENLKLAFAAEAKKLAEIKHSAFQQVFGFFSEIDRQYLVMEAIDGDSLAQLIERNKRPFALADIGNWADELLDALIYLHARTPPVIHRDIKPQNIKLALDGKVKLDISNLGKGTQAKIGSTVTNQKLHFLPFEQIWMLLDSASQTVILNNYDEKSEEILKKPADARSDLYALGATLYYLLTARLPIDALERSIDILEGKIDPLPPPNRLNANISTEISDAVMKALEIKRENRFDSAVIMRQVLRTAFVRIKEREAEKARNRSTAERTININEQDILEIEAEPIPQIDLIKRLQEAEARRLEAERRAVEAEKRLLESEAKQSESFISTLKSAEKPVQVPLQTSIPAEKNKPAEQSFSNGNSILFADPEKGNGGLKKMAIAVAALIVFGGAGFGVWSFLQTKSVAPDQSVTNQINSSTEPIKSLPANEPAAAPTNEPTTENTPATTIPSPPEADQTDVSPVVSPAVKNRPAAPAAFPKIQKQTVPPPAKTTTPEKKKITVDDLINEN